MQSGGIFGPKLSGKTTLAKHISRKYWQQYRIRSVVLDPNLEQWGAQAAVTADERKFWDEWVWKHNNLLVIVDESTETIARNKELIPVFTRLRHLHHKLLVIGHHGMNLLPIMREQLDTLYLFRQGKKAAQMWAEDFGQDELQLASQLNQYEVIYTTTYGKPRRFKVSL